jgi:hypothetical protein
MSFFSNISLIYSFFVPLLSILSFVSQSRSEEAQADEDGSGGEAETEAEGA